ncbi:MAG: glycosyltransferase [Bacteroidales bacterium]|nr:glycosyltransferase [Lachnoclostridium sp.]MCM1384121.1 glycosyltransferase [Lachnoclostridium sp.]MCM1465681.1 glycosyltransferase [Bacteroidales bacterium]
MEDILVSIVVPVYNVEKYIDECIQSLIAQTYSEIEILLIDDGSTDSSGYKCDQWAAAEPHITAFHKSNEGLGYTRNYGMERAKGRFVVFVDSDDYVKYDMIEKMMEVQEKHDADTIITGWQRVKKDKVVYSENYPYEIYQGEDNKYKLLPRFIGSRPDCKDGLFQTACAKLYSLEIIRKYDLKFVSERDYQGEDMVFQFDYFRYCKKTVILSETPYYYRQNMESLTRRYKPLRFQCSKKMYDFMEERLISYGMGEYEKIRLGKFLLVAVMGALSQEVPGINHQTVRQTILNIEKIVNDEKLDEVLKNYPWKLLNIWQQCYFWMLKNKMIYLLYFYFWMKSFT